MTKAIVCYVNAVAICAPGLPDWSTASTYLTTQKHWQLVDDAIPQTTILSPRERRRASHAVKLSLHLAEQLPQQMQLPANQLQTVFASAEGEGETFDSLAKALAQPHPEISPTIFHQSLHNSAAGYWHIATQSHQPSLALSVGEATFSGGLLAAASQTLLTEQPTLFIAYELPMPHPLCFKYPMLTWFGMGLGISPHQNTQTLAKITLRMIEAVPASPLTNSALDVLRTGNVIARSLPFLEQLARKKQGKIYVDSLPPWSLEVTFEDAAP